ncbi:MAG: tetratricopeptide repeat protein [Promethearchaeota archaeon]
MPNLKPSNSSSKKNFSNESQLEDPDLKQVEFFFYKGNLNEALKEIINLEKENKRIPARLRGQILKSLIFTQMGDMRGGLILADQIIEESQQIGDLPILFDAYIAKSSAFFELGEFNTCLEAIKTAENILLAIKTKSQLEHVKRESKLKILRGKVFRKKGELDVALGYLQEAFFITQEYGSKFERAEILNLLGIVHASRSENDSALDFLKKSMETFEELENRSQILKLTNNIGMIHWLKGELDQALEYFQKSFFLSQKEGDKIRQALSLLNISLIHRNKGDLDPALQYCEKGLKIYEESMIKSELATFYNNIGVIYQIKGELDEASKYYQKSLAIAEELGDKQEIATSLGNIGDILQYQGKLEKAINYYKRSLGLFEDIGNDVNTSRALFALIQVLEEEPIQVNNYLDKLHQIDSKEENRMINQIYRLGKAIALKSSGRIINLAEAQQLFKEITQEEILNVELTAFSMLYLCDSLILELRATGKEEILDEVKSILEQFRDFAGKRYSYHWLAQIHWLDSRLALLELDFKRSQRLLTQAITIAKDKGLQRLASQIENEYDALITRFGKWEEIVMEKPVINEIIELTQLEDLIERMIHKKLYRKEEEVLNYALLAKELVDKIDKK